MLTLVEKKNKRGKGVYSGPKSMTKKLKKTNFG